jgi:hypothetical protein
VLYECLTGRAPFEKNSNEALMWAHVHELAVPPSLLRPDLPPAADEVIARALAKNPDDRYADCREFLAAARDALAPTPTRLQFQPAPVPSGGLRDLSRGPAGRPRQSTASVLPAGTTDSRAVARRRRWGRGRGRRTVHGPGPERRSVRNMLSLLGVAVLAAGGTATGLLVSQRSNSSIGIHQAAESSSPPSTLVSVLDHTEEFTNMLNMSACAQTTATLVQCANPDPAIANVTFATYPSLSALYSKYQEIVANLTHESFGSVENLHPCSAIAPDPTGESTWNHSDQYSTKYTAAQLASGSVSTDSAMGRVFCAQKQDGSAVMVWTQDSGDLLGYATGGQASHEQVWNWFYDIHHNIIFPGQPGMTGMSMSPAATAAGSSASAP